MIVLVQFFPLFWEQSIVYADYLNVVHVNYVGINILNS